MRDWYGVWGLVSWSGTVRHAVAYDRDTDRLWTLCAHGGRWRDTKRTVEALSSDSPLMERPACQACLGRIRWTASWWAEQLRLAEASRAS